MRELSIFAGGLALMLAINLLLLRRALAPLRQLTAFARRIDPLEPGHRLDVGGGDSDAAELAAAFNEMLERLEVERRDSVARALAAQEGERLRVAQELHDGVGQSLTGVVLQLGRAARGMPSRPRARCSRRRRPPATASRRCGGSRGCCGPRRSTTSAWPSALRVLGERIAEHSELEVDVHVQPGLPDFGGDAELVLYRVAQEALTNVARHAGARRAQVRLELTSGHPLLEVDDDGRRLPAATAPKAAACAGCASAPS